MNIHEIIESIIGNAKTTWKFFCNTFGEHWKKYLIYVVVASLFCISLAELSQESAIRGWYFEWMHPEKIAKGTQPLPEEQEEKNYGKFVTYYRYKEFGDVSSPPKKTDAPMVALSFDDGPNPDYTIRIIESLRANQCQATFFVVGTNAEKYPEVLRAISLNGNEIGNHSYNHVDLTEADSIQVVKEIEKVDRAVKKSTGEYTTVIRPPYGAYNDAVLEQLQQPVVLWDLDTEDWESRDAQTIVDHIVAEVDDGDIILMHDIYESTAQAVELLLPKLKEMGYEVVSVSKMAEYKGKELELHKAYGGVK